MKTTKIIAAISIALFFGLTTVVANATGVQTRAKTLGAPAMRYNVNVHFAQELSICNVYMIEIVDQYGRKAAATQTFEQGKNTYTFYEAGPSTGIRIAKLILVPYVHHFACPTELFTRPDVVVGPFMIGQTYEFNLYPNQESGREE